MNSYIAFINTSEGIKQPNLVEYYYNNFNYYYYYNITKHDLNSTLCFHLINKENKGIMGKTGNCSFYYGYINEYEITNKFFYYYKKKSNNESIICLKPTNDISIFYINKTTINLEFYKENYIKTYLNNEAGRFSIDNLFIIKGNEDFIFDSSTVSLEIIGIYNKKGKLFNENEELNENSFFNPKNNYLIHKRGIDDGYYMLIIIGIKPRYRYSISFSIAKYAEIHLFVPQKNCTMSEISSNYCFGCLENYGKKDSKCYHKSEKFSNLYYDDVTHTWKKCETSKNIYKCSICDKGSYINNNNYCEKCPKGYYSNRSGSKTCTKCNNGYISFPGSSECFISCEPGNNENEENISICHNDETNDKIIFKSKILTFFINNETDNFYINYIFDDYNINLNDFSFKIIKIINKKGRLFNGDEEIFEDNDFYVNNNYLTYKKENDEGYSISFYIEVKRRNQQNLNTEKSVVIYLYVSQENCTMTEVSNNNYCQGCQEDFGKNDTNCYHKSEKFTNLFYDDSTQI